MGIAKALSRGAGGWLGALLLSLSLATTAHAAGAPAPGKLAIADLAQACTPAAVAAVAARLPYRLTPGEVVNGPKFAGGTKYVAPTASRPGYCQITGTVVTNPKTGKTANFLATLRSAAALAPMTDACCKWARAGARPG